MKSIEQLKDHLKRYQNSDIDLPTYSELVQYVLDIEIDYNMDILKLEYLLAQSEFKVKS